MFLIRRSFVSAVLGFAFAFVVSAAPPLPTINTNNIINITSYSAIGDGVATNTTAIQNAINAAALGGTTNGLTGGVVKIPAGTFLSGPITLKNYINLQLDAGATLRMLPLFQYPGGTNATVDFITADGLHDIAITGSGGIDGQGLPWWQLVGSNMPVARPVLISMSPCTKVLVQNVTLSNSPSPQLVIKGKGGNITVQGVSILAPPSDFQPANLASHNTDGIDLAETNCLIQDCFISTGDDNIAIGSSGSLSRDILVTNCAFGEGHGLSIGSYTSSGVSNLTVINCTFNGTDDGIRLKSQRGRGGLVQNLNYLNLGMTNVQWPILIYSYYNFGVGTLTAVSASFASTDVVQTVSSTTPIWRNITFSNITATTTTVRPAVMIWGLPEMLVSNVVCRNVNIAGQKTCQIFNADGIQFLDSTITLPATSNTFTLYNARLIVSNSATSASLVTLDGLSTNGIVNTLSFYNTSASLKNTNVLAASPSLTLGGATLTVSNHLALSATPVNFVLGSSPATIIVRSNLSVNSTLNIATNGSSFGPGSYTLFNYGGTLDSAPQLGATPNTGHAYLYSLNTNTPSQINFVIANPPAPQVSAVQLLNETNVVLSGFGGTTNFSIYVLSATNLSVPLSNWTRISTNSFAANGTFSFTNKVPVSSSQNFYLLQYP